MRIAALLAALLCLGACQLRPLYKGGGAGPVATALGGVAVGDVAGRAGWLLRGELAERLPLGAGEAPRYRLEVELQDDITGFGIRADNAVTRERRSLRARFRLIDAPTNSVLLDATAGSDAGVDVVGSEYATLAAEQTALERLAEEVADQIVARLALYVRRTTGGEAAPTPPAEPR